MLLLTAGQRLGDKFSSYSQSVITFDWKDFYENWEGERYFEWLRTKFETMADVVLIDSRTGVTEIGGVCTYQMADAVLLFCAPNSQNLHGTQEMAVRLASPKLIELRGGRPLQVIVIPARVERSDSKLLDDFKIQFLKTFDGMVFASGLAAQDLWNLGISYVPKYALAELVAVREERDDDLASAEILASEIRKLGETLVKIIEGDHGILKHICEITGTQSDRTRFDEFDHLTELSLSSPNLTILPPEIGQLNHLNVLKLGNIERCSLKSLPSEIGFLSRLNKLSVLGTEVHVLPPEIGHLLNLTLLDFTNSKLNILPDSLGQLANLTYLDLSGNRLTFLPESLGQLTNLTYLDLSGNHLGVLPRGLGQLTNLTNLHLSGNPLEELPEWLVQLTNLSSLKLSKNKLDKLPDWVVQLTKLTTIQLSDNNLRELPEWFVRLEHLKELDLDNNPLNPELAAAYEQGLDAVISYLRAKSEEQIVLNEAKLILVGEGGVGKTSLLAALRGDPWSTDRKTTYGIEVDIKSLVVQGAEGGAPITLNGWDFGGQQIYHHTHQLFFTAPAVYLVVWSSGRGPEQCRVREWIRMIKHRTYDEARPTERPRILIVATHGRNQARLGRIDEQAVLAEFGDLIAGFYYVDSKPDANGVYYQLDELKAAIGREAAAIPSAVRMVPQSWKRVLDAIRLLSATNPYIPYTAFESLCAEQGVAPELAATYAVILNELGHLIYYRGDETLQETVILKPDYLSKAVSFVLEDKETKEARGLVEHQRLRLLWHNPDRPADQRYPPALHPIFMRLMNRFDLAYQVVMPDADAPPTSLMVQLVPSVRPEGWQDDWVLKPGDAERTQVCRILDALTGRAVEAEGLMYRLIVRLHRYSLGRQNYYASRHWKTGLLLDDSYNGRAFIEEIAGDIYITVRAAYPDFFLGHLCAEVQWLVDHFWKGLEVRLYVVCPTPQCKGLLERGEILDFKSAGMPKVRCAVCRQFHEIDALMAPVQPKPAWSEALAELRDGQQRILQAQARGVEAFSMQLRVIMSQADERYNNLLASLSDPAKEGPRLFTLMPVNRNSFNPRSWVNAQFRLTLWCEHSRRPLPILNGLESKKGLYELELSREWFKRAAPYLKVLNVTLSLVLPVAKAGYALQVNEAAFKAIEEQLDFGTEVIDASLSGSKEVGNWLEVQEGSFPEHGHSSNDPIRAHGPILRELHAMLKAKDPGFGGLVRVQNKRREFLWVHERFVSEY